MNEGRSHSSIRSNQTSTPLKSCLTLRNSCKCKMCASFRIGELVPDVLLGTTLVGIFRENIPVRWVVRPVDRPAREHSTATGPRCFSCGSFSHLEHCRSVDPLSIYSGVECFLGCGQLSTLEEQLVIIFTEMRGDDNNRLTVTINQAYKVQSFSSSREYPCS